MAILVNTPYIYGLTGDPVFDVTAFGSVDKTGATSSNAAFAAVVAAINAAPRGGVLFIPTGVYLVNTGTIVFTTSNPVAVIGSDRETAVIVPSGTGDVIQLNSAADGCSIQSLSIFSGTPQTAGNAINTNGADDVFVNNVLFNNQFVDVNINSSSIKVTVTHTVHTQTNGSATSVGIVVNNGLAGDTYIGPDVVMSNTGATRRAASVQVTVSGHFEINQANLTGSVQGLLVNPGAAQIVGFGFVNEVLFDSCTVNGVTLNATTSTSTIKSIEFVNSWFSGTVTGTGGAGFVTTGVAGGILDGIVFTACRFLNNQTHGFLHGFGTNVRLTECRISGNSAAGANTSDGVNIATTLSNWSIIGSKVGGTDAASTGGNQRWGINLAAGVSTNYLIQDCDLTGNTTGSLNDLGTIATNVSKAIGTNLGGALAGVPLVSTTAGLNTTETVLAAAPGGLNGLQVGTTYRFKAFGTCTASVANASTLTIRFGTAGSTADASCATFTTATSAATGTAIPFMVEILFTVRANNVTTGTLVGGGVVNNQFLTAQGTATTGISIVQNQVIALAATATLNTTLNGFFTVSYKSAAVTTTATFTAAFLECVKA